MKFFARPLQKQQERMAGSDSVRALIGKWEQVACENIDDFLKEMGMGAATRLVARNVHPSYAISENNGQWTVKSEVIIRSQSLTFTPGIEFNDTLPDGLEVKVGSSRSFVSLSLSLPSFQCVVTFDKGQWIENIVGKNGKELRITRHVDDHDQQQMVSLFDDGATIEAHLALLF